MMLGSLQSVTAVHAISANRNVLFDRVARPFTNQKGSGALE